MSKFKNVYFAFIMLAVCILSMLCNLSISLIAHSEQGIYSNVLDDLKKDSTFKHSDYKIDNLDFSLNLVQITEVDKNLIVYVYQPCVMRNLKATSINISTSLGDDLSFENYTLTFINSSDTLYKYKVDGLEVKAEEKRYYEIASIFRAWNEFIDNSADKTTENTIDEVVYKVAKAYTFTGQGNEKTLFCQDIEVIEVVSKYVGYVRYNGGFFLYEKSCDSHFVAFSTEKKIEKLMEAEMAFKTKVKSTSASDNNKEDYKKVVITDDNSFTLKPLWDKKHIKNRISSVNEFLKEEAVKDKYFENFNDKEWVLRFYESDYMYKALGHIENMVWVPDYKYTEVSEVTIFRLKFETDGKVYNLGVVDNKQTGGSNSINIKTIPFWLKIVLIVVGVIVGLVLLIVLAPQIIMFILKIILKIIFWILKALWWLLTLPIRLFKKD